MTPTIETSLLLRRMHDALASLGRPNLRLHVSVANDVKWEASPAGDQVLVRWVCWSVESDGNELLAPEFEVVGKDVTAERLRQELPDVFKDVEVLVDNDIDV